jgi:hypothetical protein
VSEFQIQERQNVGQLDEPPNLGRHVENNLSAQPSS